MDGACRARERAPRRCRPRRPNQSVLHRCVQEHFETWLARCDVATATMTTGRCRRTLSASFAATSTAAPSPEALPGRGVDSAVTTS
jgi:hypothetical protein